MLDITYLDIILLQQNVGLRTILGNLSALANFLIEIAVTVKTY
jgi:hypothetical protein